MLQLSAVKRGYWHNAWMTGLSLALANLKPGTGKTTSAIWLAHVFAQAGNRVLLVDADPSGSALEWSDLAALDPRVAPQQAFPYRIVALPSRELHRRLPDIARDDDVVIIDTAGRLHTQDDLMAELEKVRRVIAKQIPEAPHETLLTVDATTGQNGLRQARLFAEAIGVDGLILTKLDGTAKGGIALAIASELGIPVKLIGVGEQLEDLRPFDPPEYARALIS